MNSTRTAVAGLARSFNGLSLEESRYLREWQAQARAFGVDGVEDLAGRSWPCPIDGVVLGVFMRGDQAASWLVVKHNGEWAVARCDDLSVSRPVDSLAEALDQLRPPGGDRGEIE
jgi:hypothetical protein